MWFNEIKNKVKLDRNNIQDILDFLFDNDLFIYEMGII